VDLDELSRLLFEAREQISMWGDVVENRVGRRDPYVDELVKRIDEFRAAQGWDPNGFGS
jgi:hypothetical protein